jgi:hypothetical protein
MALLTGPQVSRVRLIISMSGSVPQVVNRERVLVAYSQIQRSVENSSTLLWNRVREAKNNLYSTGRQA